MRVLAEERLLGAQFFRELLQDIGSNLESAIGQGIEAGHAQGFERGLAADAAARGRIEEPFEAQRVKARRIV